MHDSVNNCIPEEDSKGRSYRRHWWDNECSVAHHRNRLFFRIWKDCGRPITEHANQCYKYAHKKFRRVCLKAKQNRINHLYHSLDSLYQKRNRCQLLKGVHSLKNNASTKNTSNTISFKTLEDYFEDKLKDNIPASESRNLDE